MRHCSFALVASLAVAGSGCGGPAKDKPADGGDLAPQYTYTPEGCDYEVRTPLVIEAGPHAASVGGTAAVDHLHASWASRTDTGFAVNWRSNPENLESQLLLGTDEAAVASATAATDEVRAFGGHHLLYEDLVDERTRLHEVHLCGLAADTQYFYKVGGASGWSAVYPFATGPAQGTDAPVRFAVFGDSRNPKGDVWPSTVEAAAEAGADFALFSGDAVFLGTQQALWNDFFEASKGNFRVDAALASMPLLTAHGNHETLAVNYFAQFAFPQVRSEGELGDGEEWYSLDYGPAHVAVLNDTVADDGVLAGAQAKWLDADLAAVDRAKTPWVFVVHHRSFYTCGSNHDPDDALRAAWQPIFDEHAVDIVFNGHNHVYERSLPIRGLSDGEGMIAAAGENGVPTVDGAGVASGTVYIVSAGAGAELYDVSDACPYTLKAQSVHNYTIVDLDGPTITVKAVNTETGGTIDEFSYSKAD